MSELRAPDPTLADHGDDDVMLRQREGLPYEAHLITVEADGLEVSACARWATTLVLNAQDARWFAVPCRECFPSAPDPGYPDDHGPECCTPHPALAWQVSS